MSHSILAPSASSRWLTCTASIAAIEKAITDGIPMDDGDSVYATEGSQAHKVAEHSLLDFDWDPTEHIGSTHEGDKYLDPFVVDSGMADGALVWRSYVLEHYDRDCPDSDIGVEHRVSLFYRPADGGTVDCWVYDATARTLHVIDYKYGKGIKVDAQENTQLRIYAASLVNELGIVYDIERVACHIVMPRLHHYSSEYLTYEELGKWSSTVNDVVDSIRSGLGVFAPSDSACRWCPVSGFCEARAKKNLETLSMEFDNLENDSSPQPEPTILSPEAVSTLLQLKPEIEKWLKDVQAHAYHLLENGTAVPGWKLVDGKSNRAWTNEEDALLALRKVFNRADLFTEKMVSPAKALELCKARKKKASTVEGIQALITKPKGSPTLAPESDSRPPLVSQLDEFDDLELDILN